MSCSEVVLDENWDETRCQANLTQLLGMERSWNKVHFPVNFDLGSAFISAKGQKKTYCKHTVTVFGDPIWKKSEELPNVPVCACRLQTLNIFYI